MEKELDNLKEEYRKLVKTVQNNSSKTDKKLTMADMAARLRYDPTYFSALKGKSGKITRDHIIEFKKEFAEYLENQNFSETFQTLINPIEQGTDIVEMKAFMKTLLHAVAKLQSKLYGMTIDECLDELVKDTRLNVRGLKGK